MWHFSGSEHCRKSKAIAGIFVSLLTLLYALTGQAQAVTPQIAAGNSHTVALMSDGTVKAWGDNGYGKLGNGSTLSSSPPVTVTGLGGTVTAIAAGYYHTVALMSDGTV